jgi:hypothetical protein
MSDTTKIITVTTDRYCSLWTLKEIVVASAANIEVFSSLWRTNDNPMSAVADSERNFHVTNWKYRNVVRRFSWIVVLMTHTVMVLQR